MRLIGVLICLSVGIFLSYHVKLQVADTFADPWWAAYVSAAVVVIVVFSALYFPLFRPICDIISDKLHSLQLRFTSKSFGSGIDDIPDHLEAPKSTNSFPNTKKGKYQSSAGSSGCAYCDSPQGPVCDNCHGRISKI